MIMNNSINYILYIYIFEKKCVLIKGMLQSPRIEDHMKTIDIHQSLSNRPSVEHKYLNNIKKIYNNACKCDEQQNIKDVLDADMVCTPYEVTDISISLHITQTTIKKPSARKSLCLFTIIFDVKKRTDIRRVEYPKSKHRAIKVENSLCTN